MTIAQPLNFKVGFEAQKIRLVPNGTADFNYKAFLFELTVGHPTFNRPVDSMQPYIHGTLPSNSKVGLLSNIPPG